MMIVNPDDEKEYVNFLREWKSHYPVTRKGKKTQMGLKPPSVVMLRTLYAYATDGSIPGDSVVALLTDSLYCAFNTAPLEELELIPSSIQYITTYLPTEAWGNPEKYGKWIQNKRRSKAGKPTDFY